jgi:uncharacterized protein YdcH (DUF465 family)
MTDTTETVPTEEPVVEPTTTDAGPIQLPDDHPLVKTLAAQKELIKDLKGKAGRLDEIEEAQKTELQKAIERAERAEQAVVAAESARLKASIAAKHGVPEALLTGSDEESLEQAAQVLLAFKGTPPTAPSSDGQGKAGESISGGVKQITSLDELEKLSPEEVNKARRDGRLNALMGINS